MGLMKNILKANLMNFGDISGSAWELGSFIGFKKDDNGEFYLLISDPKDKQSIIATI